MVARNDTTEAPENRLVFITRVFDAPRELVFNAWTNAEHLMQWFSPRVCTVKFHSFDFREGGGFFSCIRSPEGHECWCQSAYREIVAPSRLVFTMAMANANGELVAPVDIGMDPEWPAETVVTVTFEDLEGKTKLTLHQTVLESLAKRTGAYPSWLEMLDRLADNLRDA